MFDPKPYLIQLPRKVKDKATGHWTTVYDDYLEVKWRLCWFRDRYPHGIITTEEICVDLDRGYARYRAVVEDGEGGRAIGYGTETAEGFADYVERAETRALGRALAALGIGTQFVGQDLTEGDHVADAPVRPLASSNGHAPEADVTAGTETPEATEPPSPPAVIPTDAGLPCSGQAISTLKPAQLAMLVSKVARLVHDDGARWVPLLAALQAERGAHLDRGQQRKGTPATPETSSAEGNVPDFSPPVAIPVEG
jgi:hypothetical protein